MKRLLSKKLIALPVIASLFLPMFSAAAAPSDVPTDAWYHDAVGVCYEKGILSGVSDTTFAPDGLITTKEAIVIAARIHSMLNDRKITATGDWFTPYEAYLQTQGVLQGNEYFTDSLMNRELFADLIYKVLPNNLPAINATSEIPAYLKTGSYYKTVLYLYQTGILGGTDVYGRFSPYKTLTRAEVAVICQRILDSNRRIKVSFSPLPAPNITQLSIDLTDIRITDFDGTYLFCENSDYKHTVFDLTGKQLFPWGNAFSFSDGVFMTSDGDFSQFYDTAGTLLFTTDKLITGFENGYALAVTDPEEGEWCLPYELIDKQGTVIKRVETTNPTVGAFPSLHYRSEGYCIVYLSPTRIGLLELETGKITPFDQHIVDYSRMQNGIYMVRYYDENWNVHENFIDTKGNMLLKNDTNRIFRPFNGKDFIASPDQNHYGILNMDTEEWKVPPIYDDINLGNQFGILYNKNFEGKVENMSVIDLFTYKIVANATILPSTTQHPWMVDSTDFFVVHTALENWPNNQKVICDIYGNVIIPSFYEQERYADGKLIYQNEGKYYVYTID